MTVALIDGDEAVFKACCKKGSELDWDTGDSMDRPPTFAEARANLDQMIEDWTEAAGCDSHVVVLSPDDRKLFRPAARRRKRLRTGESSRSFAR